MQSDAYNILVVEDDDLVRSLIVQSLQRRPQLRLDQASSKAEALELTMLKHYDVVVSDIRLEAAAAGVELLQAVKDHSPGTAVILLTAYGTLNTAIGALREHADDYLLKPLSMAELDASVDAALRRRTDSLGRQTTLRQVLDSLQNILGYRGDAAARECEAPHACDSRFLTVGAIQLDMFQHRAAIDGDDLDLTCTEWTILQVLARACAKVVTFEQIVEQTHQVCMPHESARSLLASHIRNLRRKLGPFSNQLQNVRGVGFSLAAAVDYQETFPERTLQPALQQRGWGAG